MFAQDGAMAFTPLILGAVLAFVIALLSIGAMMAIIQRIGFMPFVIYRIVLGLILLSSVYLT